MKDFELVILISFLSFSFCWSRIQIRWVSLQLLYCVCVPIFVCCVEALNTPRWYVNLRENSHWVNLNLLVIQTNLIGFIWLWIDLVTIQCSRASDYSKLFHFALLVQIRLKAYTDFVTNQNRVNRNKQSSNMLAKRFSDKLKVN